jgi:cobalt-zinc-cadmium efflux system outer membrane protein
LSERLELGGKRQARNQLAGSVVAIAQAEQAAKHQALRAAVTEAFYQALAAQERIKLSQSALSLAQRVHDAAIRRLAAGKVAPIEGSKALVAQASAQLEFSQAQSELRVARDQLAGLLGLPKADFASLDGSLQSLPAPLSWEQLEARLQDAPELQRAGHELQRRQADIALQRSLRVPDITVSAGVKRDEALGENMAVVGVSLPIPLFQQNQGGLLEAVRRADKAQAEQQSTYLRHRGQLLQTFERFNNTREEAESLRLQVLPAASNAYELASKGYELGKFNILDVLDAQRSLFQIQASYLRVMLDVHRHAAEIERLTGGTANAATPSVKQE